MEWLQVFTRIVVIALFFSSVSTIKEMTIPCVLNNSCRLPCRVDQLTGVNVRWFNGKNELLSQGVIVRQHRRDLEVENSPPNEWNLLIKRVKHNFADTYTCKTSTGTVLSVITVVIEEGPKIDEIKSTKTPAHFQEFSEAVVKCAVTGVPEPDIRWYRGYDQELMVGLEGQNLIIPTIQRHASDVYTCRATNKHGNQERHMTVVVNFSPEVSVMEDEVYAAGGDLVVMACMVQASPLYVAYWTDNDDRRISSNWKFNVTVEEEKKHFPVRFLVLRITANVLSSHDYGSYTCIASGTDSEANAIVKLKRKG